MAVRVRWKPRSSNLSTRKMGYRIFKLFANTVLFGVFVPSLGILGLAHPTQIPQSIDYHPAMVLPIGISNVRTSASSCLIGCNTLLRNGVRFKQSNPMASLFVHTKPRKLTIMKNS